MANKQTQEGIAIVGIGAVMPGASDAGTFWRNILAKEYSIGEVPERSWDWRLYYDSDRKAPDKTYSKIGGFIRDFKFDPLSFRIPPGVAAQMDLPQQYAVEATRQALADAGYAGKDFGAERTGVMLGNAMGGTKKEASDLRIYSTVLRESLRTSPALAGLPSGQRTAVLDRLQETIETACPRINEDSMPGELSNVIAGRIANVFNLNGPNYTVDAACASSLAALDAAVKSLRSGEIDVAISGGVDQMMGPAAFIKFAKIGALSAEGSFPFDARANGFVMGEGVGIYVLKRVSDALRDGDRVYAVIRAVGASSDGKGKGITAPNPKGQKLAVENAFRQLDYTPAEVSLIEAHGTSTTVGDRVEAGVLSEVFGPYSRGTGSIGLGSVKSNIGHLKAAAGAASLIKMAFALKEKVLPPSARFETPNPEVQWAQSPVRVLQEANAWDDEGKTRRGNVSSFGFGGTNFHVAMEEFREDRATRIPNFTAFENRDQSEALPRRAEKLQGSVYVFSGKTPESLLNQAKAAAKKLPEAPTPMDLESQPINAAPREEYRAAIAAENPRKLAEKVEALEKNAGHATNWKRIPNFLRAKSIYPRKGLSPRPKIAFLFPGQGSQYVDMLADLRDKYRIVAETFEEADRILKGIIGETLSDILFTKEGESAERTAARQERIKRTEITQPAVLTANIAILRLLKSFGVSPDVVAGHSLGEYGALVAAGVMRFEDALYTVSARGREMADVRVPDPGKMAGISAPVSQVEEALKGIEGYVTCANKNCHAQTVIAGESQAVEEAVAKFSSQGIPAQVLQVSHAFHSRIVAPAQENYRKVLDRFEIRKPSLPILSNVTADYYPENPIEIRDLLVRQIASEVEWIGQIERMYDDGVRLFVEVGPKRVLTAFVVNTLESKGDVIALSSNHPKRGGVHEFNDLLARLSVEGVGLRWEDKHPVRNGSFYADPFRFWCSPPAALDDKTNGVSRSAPQEAGPDEDDYYGKSLVVSGVGAGVPGSWDKVFRDGGLDEILRGQNLIEKLPEEDQDAQVSKNIVRLVKSASGDHRFEKLESAAEVIKLAAKAGEFDIAEEFGLPEGIAHALDRSSAAAMGAGIKALADARIPLVRRYKGTTIGTRLPDGWALPESMREDTGVIFASAFPSLDAVIGEVSRHLADKFNRKPLEELQKLFETLSRHVKDPQARRALDDWNRDWLEPRKEAVSKQEIYSFSRDFLLKAMPIGNAQFSQWIGARGPSMALSAACASTTQAVSVAEDWLRLNRCRRVVVIAGDDVTSPNLMEWVSTGFLISGAATTKGNVSEAALPFDRRRHGMILGMGALGMVLERGEDAQERGIRPSTEVVATQFQNSAFHATRLDPDHVKDVMQALVEKAERRLGRKRDEIARSMLFMSHETYTPARGGSASAEVKALKHCFGKEAASVVVSNTKGFTGHTMGASLEDVVAIRALTTGQVPPIANYREPDPELEGIRLSDGSERDLKYVLRLGAGFGSQMAMTFMRRLSFKQDRIADDERFKTWLSRISGQAAPELETVQQTLRVKEAEAKPSTPSPETVPEPPAPAVPAPVPVAAPAAATASKAPSREEARKVVLELVQEKTGYPEDMLELDLDMEADLGIDTVKQAEIFGLLRERFGIAPQEGLSIKDYPTLNHVIAFVSETNSETPERPAAEKEQAEGEAVASSMEIASGSVEAHPENVQGSVGAEEAEAAVLELVMEKTGYPREMLELDLDMEADLGIDTVKQAEIFGVLRERFGIAPQEGLSIKDYPTLRHVIGFLTAPAGGEGEAATGADLEASIEKTQSAKTKVWIASSGTQAKDGAPIEAQVRLVTPPPGTQELEAAASNAGTDEEGIRKAVLAKVMEKTGYPEEMLEMDLDMEADLGIDTVKQAEIFGTLREAFGIAPVEGLQLKDYPTLRSVVRFISENAPDGVPENAALAPAEPEESVEAGIVLDERFKRWELESVEVPFSAGEAPIAFAPRAPILLVAGEGKNARAFGKVLSDRGLDVWTVCPDPVKGAQVKRCELSDHDAIVETVETWGAALGGFQGLVFVPSRFGDEAELKFSKKADQTVGLLFRLAKKFATHWKGLLAATRIDGRHGLGRAKGWDPILGGVTGFVKAFRKEYPEAKVKAVDLDPKTAGADAAQRAVREWIEGPASCEVAYDGETRTELRLVEKAFETETEPVSLESANVLVTGGGQGLGAEMAKRLARIPEIKLFIVGRTELVPEAESYARLTPGELAEKKAGLWTALREQRGKKATPVVLEREFSKITKAADLWKNLDAMRRAGATVEYFAADVGDEKSFVKALQMNLRGTTIDAAIHAAGLDQSKLLKDKPLKTFEDVFYVKASGADVLSRYLKKEPLLLMFGSVVGRFGNLAQCDYAAANDYLAKLARHLEQRGRRAASVQLTAFSDIGMATRGSVEAFLKKSGVDFMKPAQGVEMLLEELRRASNPEPMLAGALGALDQDGQRVGADAERSAPVEEPVAERPNLLDAVQNGTRPFEGKTEFSLAAHPYLDDHRVGGTPYVPGVIGLEMFARAAEFKQGRSPRTLKNVRYELPIKLLRDRAITPRVVEDPEGFRIESDFISPAGIKLGAPRVHFRASASDEGFPEGWNAPEPPRGKDFQVGQAGIYDKYFHGPRFQILKGIVEVGENGVLAEVQGKPKRLWDEGQERQLCFSPMLIEAAFQACGFRDLQIQGRMTLPDSIGTVTVSGEAPKGRCFVKAQFKGADDDGKSLYDAWVFDEKGTLLAALRDYRMIPS